MRLAFLLVFALPLAAQEPQLTPFEEQKSRAILRDQLPCLGCHELAGEGGRMAPSLTTVADRRNAAYIRAIIEDPQRIVPGAGMPKTLMPAATQDLVIRYLARRAGPSAPPTPPPPPRSYPIPVGSLYQRWCAACHGHNGSGDGPNAKYLPVPPALHSNTAKMSVRSDDALFDAIAGGGAIMGKSARMPAFGATLTPAEIRSLVAYIRTLCSCAGPTWSREGSSR